MPRHKTDARGDYYIIFRWTRKCPRTGKIIRARNRPFPIKIYIN